MTDVLKLDVIRVDPDTQLGERETLEAFVEFHRATLLQKCSGLTHDQLRERAIPPSALSLIGLIRHMTDVDASWLQEFAAEPYEAVHWSPERKDRAFEDVESSDVDADIAAYLAKCDQARAAVAGVGLDDTMTDDGTTFSLRWVFTHLIEEYARHNGHADLLRERLDGATGE